MNPSYLKRLIVFNQSYYRIAKDEKVHVHTVRLRALDELWKLMDEYPILKEVFDKIL